MKSSLPFLLLLLHSLATHAQLDSIFDQGSYRTFIVHLPSGYSAVKQYPLVFNLHGLNSNAAQQQAYSQFDAVADSQAFIVVYPNGLNNSWSIGGNTDVTFIAHLVDTLCNRYSCNNCLFFTGISDGGFMTYKLACALSKPITAIAVVAGNMATTLQASCAVAAGLPVMHFHGTADQIVNYNGTFGIPPVETTIQWWVNKNNCSTTPVMTPLPDINPGDSCTVEEYFYGSGVKNSSVTFYKILNGGHTWPGAVPVPPLGFTNQDINASSLIGKFFRSFCPLSTGIDEPFPLHAIVFPNPAIHRCTIEIPATQFDIVLYNNLGEVVLLQKNISEKIIIDTYGLSRGVYYITAVSDHFIFHQKLVVGE